MEITVPFRRIPATRLGAPKIMRENGLKEKLSHPLSGPRPRPSGAVLNPTWPVGAFPKTRNGLRGALPKTRSSTPSLWVVLRSAPVWLPLSSLLFGGEPHCEKDAVLHPVCS